MANLLALIAATAILVMIPGPNVALIVANSLRFGLRMGTVTVLGTTLGVALQLLAVVGASEPGKGPFLALDLNPATGSMGHRCQACCKRRRGQRHCDRS